MSIKRRLIYIILKDFAKFEKERIPKTKTSLSEAFAYFGDFIILSERF